MLTTILGGVGLFLIGMLLLTDGLQAIAGDALRDILARFTKTRFKSILSGAFVTALVQSSSITTLATIGFVSAELLTFSGAIGVIYGANIGTTATSWLVSLIGFKVKIELFALPMVGIGALLKLFTRGKKASIGMAIAGFGMIFVGIDILQNGMGGLADAIDLKQFAADGILGRLLLVGIGIVITVLLQSSSAAMATTLTALFSGAITLDQAAALSIGQAVGTTITAAMAAIGASIQAKRTAMAHILFNVGTAIVAFILLPLFIYITEAFFNGELSPGDNAVSLAAFFTAFKVIGVILFYPITPHFADYIQRILPEKRSRLTRRLDDAALALPQIALEAAILTVKDITIKTSRTITRMFRGEINFEHLQLSVLKLEQATRETRAYLRNLESDPSDLIQYQKHLAILHALDHLARIITAAKENKNFNTYQSHSTLKEYGYSVATALSTTLNSTEAFTENDLLDEILKEASDRSANYRREQRPILLMHTAQGQLTPDEAARILETMRWIDRFNYHFYRITDHLMQTRTIRSPERVAPESELPDISDDDSAR